MFCFSSQNKCFPLPKQTVDGCILLEQSPKTQWNVRIMANKSVSPSVSGGTSRGGTLAQADEDMELVQLVQVHLCDNGPLTMGPPPWAGGLSLSHTHTAPQCCPPEGVCIRLRLYCRFMGSCLPPLGTWESPGAHVNTWRAGKASFFLSFLQQNPD